MIFILDNFDSFTYNLYQYFGQLQENVTVRRRDQCTLADIEELNPELIVISPGPCTPLDAPLTLAVLEHFKGKIPILGICLGHQAIGQVFGARIIRAKTPMHGKVCEVTHDNKGVFANLPHPLTVTRYHSLVIDPESVPDDFIVTAHSEDGEIMGVRHRDYPIEGVQFHPEAILTEAGHQLLRNALEQARKWKESQLNNLWHVRPLALDIPPNDLLPAFKQTDAPFFLDSGKGDSQISRYSFMGAWPFLVATATQEEVELLYPNRPKKDYVFKKTQFTPNSGESGSRWLNLEGSNSLTLLDSLLSKYKLDNSTPFPFAGGAVGFFSYDLKDEIEKLPQIAEDDLEIPLWRLAWYDGIVVYDHLKRKHYLTACGMDEDGLCSKELAQARLKRLEDKLLSYAASLDSLESDSLSKAGELNTTSNSADSSSVESSLPIQVSVTRDRYLKDINRVIEYILDGDIYQANLTQRFNISYPGDPWLLYQKLHQQNPAPFAAFLPYGDFQILCSSPERFILIDAQGKIETRPIKGTRPRGKTPESDEALANELITSVKDRAELTMIIDLERNDIGQISKFGSVQVEDLIRLEKYPTVWHLVSTISGELPETIKPSEILTAIFPGGSITGAPKIRAMEIIEELEPFKRGVYTGSIGYIGFDGVWDLNIVIRTIILKEGVAYIHAGGGIVADSVPKLEYEETLHKAKALFKALGGKLS